MISLGSTDIFRDGRTEAQGNWVVEDQVAGKRPTGTALEPACFHSRSRWWANGCFKCDLRSAELSDREKAGSFESRMLIESILRMQKLQDQVITWVSIFQIRQKTKQLWLLMIHGNSPLCTVWTRLHMRKWRKPLPCDVIFPVGTVDKNPPAEAGHKGSIPGLGRSHMTWEKQLKPVCYNYYNPAA